MARYKHNHQQRPKPFRQSVKRLREPYNQAARIPEANKHIQLRKIKLEEQSEIRRWERLTAVREREPSELAQQSATVQPDPEPRHHVEPVFEYRIPVREPVSWLRPHTHPYDEEIARDHTVHTIETVWDMLYRYMGRPEWEQPRRQSSSRSVYDDGHNVHVSSVVESVKESLLNLRADPEPDFDSVVDQIAGSNLSETTKQSLTKYCSNEYEHSRFGMTTGQLFAYVWQRIQAHDSVLELERILEERVADCIDCHGNEVCFTGRFNRILSTLDGFCPDIRITISDNERITAIFLQARSGLKPYDSGLHRAIATESLLEAGFTADQFKPWVDELGDDAETETGYTPSQSRSWAAEAESDWHGGANSNGFDEEESDDD